MEIDLERLREEHQQLASRLSRLALIGISLLFVLVNAFARAYGRVNGEEVRVALQDIKQLEKISGERPNLPYILQVFSDSSDSEKEEEPAEQAASEASPSESQPVDVEAKRRALERQHVIALELEKKADEWFTISPSLLGTSLEIDVRYWILLLPVLFLAMGSYFYIGRIKLMLLRRIGAYRLQHGPDDGTVLDHLLFRAGWGRSTSYLQHPAQLENFLFRLGILGLILQLIIAGWPFWSSLDKNLLRGLLSVLAILIFYVAAYARSAARGLEMEVADLLGQTPRVALVDRIGIKMLEWSRRASRLPRRRPHISLTGGSLLTLLSLALATATSCNAGPRKGYELILGLNDALWFTADGFSGISDQFLGRTIYTASQVVALLTIALLVASSFNSRLRQRKWPCAWLWRASGIVSLFLLVDCGIVAPLGVSILSDMLRLIYWVVPVCLWYFYTLTKKTERRDRWPAVRSALLVLYTPVLILAIPTLVSKARSGLTGLPVYLTGFFLLTAGYLGLAEAQASTAQVEVPAPTPLQPQLLLE
jgi:hypothetical protein